MLFIAILGLLFCQKKTKLTVSYLLKLLEKVSFHFLKILLAFKANANHNCISCLHFLSAFTTIAVRMEKNINSVPFKQWQSQFKIKIFLLFEQCIFYLDSINVDFFFSGSVPAANFYHTLGSRKALKLN